mmetsp:Transcript_17298/g.40595  ORF Transcript_17298/g.40595 Transcript_17298/m.40595 type:complete len:204 (+) Transcript_17298:484-1095(+)
MRKASRVSRYVTRAASRSRLASSSCRSARTTNRCCSICIATSACTWLGVGLAWLTLVVSLLAVTVVEVLDFLACLCLFSYASLSDKAWAVALAFAAARRVARRCGRWLKSCPAYSAIVWRRLSSTQASFDSCGEPDAGCMPHSAELVKSEIARRRRSAHARHSVTVGRSCPRNSPLLGIIAWKGHPSDKNHTQHSAWFALNEI